MGKKKTLASFICCEKPLEFEDDEDVWFGWEEYRPETAFCEGCDTLFERRPGGSVAYKRIETGSANMKLAYCTGCDNRIVYDDVVHPVLDDEGNKIDRKYEEVPYCIRCEKKPNLEGAPIEFEEKLRIEESGFDDDGS
jgi:hypothetical protein